MYTVIYDGNCNLCSNLVQVVERLDRGQQFVYAPMQDQAILTRFGITAQDCELGMILVDNQQPNRRWQGSAAAEEIGRLLPVGNEFVSVYRALPGLKTFGDRIYEFVRDHRYQLFGKRQETYSSAYPSCDETCESYFS